MEHFLAGIVLDMFLFFLSSFKILFYILLLFCTVFFRFALILTEVFYHHFLFTSYGFLLKTYSLLFGMLYWEILFENLETHLLFIWKCLFLALLLRKDFPLSSKYTISILEWWLFSSYYYIYLLASFELLSLLSI